MILEFEDGKIVTDLEDDEFIEWLWCNWSEYDESEIDALWAGMADWEMTEENLCGDGFTVERNAYFTDEPDQITIRKVGEGEWIIEGWGLKEMEAFVEEFDSGSDWILH